MFSLHSWNIFQLWGCSIYKSFDCLYHWMAQSYLLLSIRTGIKKCACSRVIAPRGSSINMSDTEHKNPIVLGISSSMHSSPYLQFSSKMLNQPQGKLLPGCSLYFKALISSRCKIGIMTKPTNHFLEQSISVGLGSMEITTQS